MNLRRARRLRSEAMVAGALLLADVERERRTGYSWYGNYTTRFLAEEYPAWQTRWATQ